MRFEGGSGAVERINTIQFFFIDSDIMKRINWFELFSFDYGEFVKLNSFASQDFVSFLSQL